MNRRWEPTQPEALVELEALGLITDAEVQQLASVPKGPTRGMLFQGEDGVWNVFDGARWVACLCQEDAITRSQQWLDAADQVQGIR